MKETFIWIAWCLAIYAWMFVWLTCEAAGRYKETDSKSLKNISKVFKVIEHFIQMFGVLLMAKALSQFTW